MGLIRAAIAAAAVLMVGCAQAPKAGPEDGSSALHTRAAVRCGGNEETTGEKEIERSDVGREAAGASASYGGPGEFQGRASTRAGFGVLRGEAVAAGRDVRFEYQTAQTSASFADRITFSGASGRGVVIYTFALRGAASGAALVGANAFLRHGTDDDEELAEYVTVSGEFASVPHEVTFGTPVDVRAVLACEALLTRGQSGESSCRFTLTLSEIRVFDSEKRPVEGFRARGASGTMYPLAIEP